MNFWPTTAKVDPINSDGNPLGFIRFAGGEITAFDQTGAPLQIPTVSNIPTNWPLSLLGSNPGPSVISNLIVPNVVNYANARSAALEYATPASTAYVTYPTTASGGAKWTFAQSGSNWVAQQVAITPAISNGTSTRTVQFSNMSWYDNATNDAARAAKGYTAQLPPAAGSMPTVTTTTPSGSTTVSQLGGSQNVVFMHGLFSSRNTWNRMAPWINQDFRIGTEVIPSFGLTASLSSQGTSLVNEINSAGGSKYILIGHSQGGLISRYAAQQYQTANPGQVTVTGVVTLDTPHQGADVIQNGPLIAPASLALGAFLWDWTGCVSATDNFVCLLAWLYTHAGPVIGGIFGALPLAPDIADLEPGSTFLTQLNQYRERFKEAAVVGNTPQRWNEARVGWDFLAPFFVPPYCDPNFYPEDWCGERSVALGVGITYDVVEALLVLAILEEIFCPDGEYWTAIEYFGGILVGMDGIDALWNLIVSGYGASDGIVQSSSQDYPSNSAIQYPINGADSHLESTDSPYDHTTLDEVLESAQFQVPTQASCAFTATPSISSITASASTGNFSLESGAGCQWSAVSRVPWISITSGTSGTSTGTVSFSAQENPVTIPRVGAIQAGNGLSSTTFTLTQAGVCYYSLSEGPTIAVPGSGETSTVSVTTTSDCVWSVVSSSSWLTITSGAAPNYCPQTIYEGGYVAVTVGSQTFTESYGGSGTTAAQVASGLASLMNAPGSLVSGTVSGATITIRSILNGAATNYPLSTSYQYDTTDFSSPAFTGQASGARLTGGAD